MAVSVISSWSIVWEPRRQTCSCQPASLFHPVIPNENLEAWNVIVCNTSCSTWELFVSVFASKVVYEMLAAGVLVLLMRKEEHELCCFLIISCKIKSCCSLVWHWMPQSFEGLKLLYEFRAWTKHKPWTKWFTLSFSVFQCGEHVPLVIGCNLSD